MSYPQEMSEMVDGVRVIDWSKGPRDAQLYTPETDENFEGFMKIEEGVAYCFVPSIGMTDWRREMVRSAQEVLDDKSMIAKEAV